MTTKKSMLNILSLYYFFTIATCVDLPQLDSWDFTEELAYGVRALQTATVDTVNSDETSVVVVKPVYTLADDFAQNLQILIHKITQTFVKISRVKTGQQTLQHIYNEFYTITTDKVSANSLRYIMEKIKQILQNGQASLVIVEIAQMLLDILQYNLEEWHFVIPFLYYVNQNPFLIQIVEKGLAELHFIQEKDERKTAALALMNELTHKLSTPITVSTATATTDETVTEIKGENIPVTETVSDLPSAAATSARISKQLSTNTATEGKGEGTFVTENVSTLPAAPARITRRLSTNTVTPTK